MFDFDIAIIGGGPGGYTAALAAAKRDMRVVLIEEQALGGTCLNVGCIPTKAYLHMAKTFYNVKAYKSQGVIDFDGEACFNYQNANKRRDIIVDKLRDGLAKYLAFNKIKIVLASACIVDKNTISVEGANYTAQNIIFATGSKPNYFDVLGIENAVCVEALAKEIRLSSSVVVIGGGAAGLEAAELYHKLGAKVDIVMMEQKVLPYAEKDMGQFLGLSFRKKGITMHCGMRVVAVNANESGFGVDLMQNDHVLICHELPKKTISADLVIAALGRQPRLNKACIDKVGVVYDDGGIKVDKFFKTNVDNIYAIGDVVSGNIKLAHKAMFDAEIAVQHILSQGQASSNTLEQGQASSNTLEQGQASSNTLEQSQASVNILATSQACQKNIIPMCIYATPEISWVGLTSEQSVAAGLEYVAGKASLGANGKAVACGEDTGFIKVIFVKEQGCDCIDFSHPSYKLAGVHMVAANSDDYVGAFATMIANGLTKEDILKAPFAHPSIAESFIEAVRMAK